MAKPRDRVWYVDDKGEKHPAVVTKGQTLVDGIPTADSYDTNTVDLALHVEHIDEAGVAHSMITGGVAGAKRALTTDDQKQPGHWWPKG